MSLTQYACASIKIGDPFAHRIDRARNSRRGGKWQIPEMTFFLSVFFCRLSVCVLGPQKTFISEGKFLVPNSPFELHLTFEVEFVFFPLKVLCKKVQHEFAFGKLGCGGSPKSRQQYRLVAFVTVTRRRRGESKNLKKYRKSPLHCRLSQGFNAAMHGSLPRLEIFPADFACCLALRGIRQVSSS